MAQPLPYHVVPTFCATLFLRRQPKLESSVSTEHIFAQVDLHKCTRNSCYKRYSQANTTPDAYLLAIAIALGPSILGMRGVRVRSFWRGGKTGRTPREYLHGADTGSERFQAFDAVECGGGKCWLSPSRYSSSVVFGVSSLGSLLHGYRTVDNTG
jgi:hypothetical protein